MAIRSSDGKVFEALLQGVTLLQNAIIDEGCVSDEPSSNLCEFSSRVPSSLLLTSGSFTDLAYVLLCPAYTVIMDSEECDRSTTSLTASGALSGHSSSATSNSSHSQVAGMATPASSPYFLDSAVPSDSDLTYDHHSSEEELEVINGKGSRDSAKRVGRSPYGNRCRSVNSAAPEKRKWSDAMDTESSSPPGGGGGCGSSAASHHRPRVRVSTRRHASSSDENICAAPASGEEAAAASASAPPPQRCASTSLKAAAAGGGCSSGASSDDETTTPSGAFAPISPSTPVHFSRSPPLDAHRPPTVRSLSPPLKMLNCDSTAVDQQRSQYLSSPRYKRHRQTPTQRSHHAHNIQRPCLDFEKMQQVRTRLQCSLCAFDGMQSSLRHLVSECK